MTDERRSDEEITAIMAELEAAGLLTIRVDAERRETWVLTPMGAPVPNQMAMGHEDHAVMLDALLDASQPDTPNR